MALAVAGIGARDSFAQILLSNATLSTPSTCTATVAAGELYPIHWQIVQGTLSSTNATVDVFATPIMTAQTNASALISRPPPASIPIALDVAGGPTTGIASVGWDTTDVPSGSYFVWSRVNEPIPVWSIWWAPGIVTVIRSGDEPRPVVMLTQPDEFHAIDNFIDLEWCHRDPDGGGRLILEVANEQSDCANLIAIADVPVADGRFRWDTSCVEHGLWHVRATLIDRRGRSFTSWSRFTIGILHTSRGRDGGVSTCPVAEPLGTDGGAFDLPLGEHEDAGCDCSEMRASPTVKRSGGTSHAAAFGAVGLLLAVRFARARRIKL